MKEKLYRILNKVYGITMFAAFFGGVIPLIPFLISIAIGGPTGEALTNFFYQKYYPVIIALASIAVVIGLIAMYVRGEQALSTKSLGKK